MDQVLATMYESVQKSTECKFHDMITAKSCTRNSIIRYLKY